MKNIGSIIENVVTPCFIVDMEELENNIRLFKEALNNNFKENILSYSVKTNSSPVILKAMHENDVFAEVVSHDEYMVAKKMGFGRRVVYNGPLKSFETFKDAVTFGCIINIETHRELRWLEELDEELKNTCNIGIRANFDMSAVLPGECSYDEEGSRFGFSIDTNEFRDAIQRINNLKNVKLRGIHMHRTSKTRSIKMYRALIGIFVKIINSHNLNIDYLDIGGGYYGGLPNKPQYIDYITAIKEELDKFGFTDIKLICEPGNALIASPVSMVTSVVDTKKTKYSNFVTVDCSRNDIDPLYNKTDYFKTVFSKNACDNRLESQIISGCTCLEFDRLFTLSNEKELIEGDRILFDKVGAYTMCLSPLFIRFFPKVYCLYKDGSIELVANEWDYNDFLKKYCKNKGD